MSRIRYEERSSASTLPRFRPQSWPGGRDALGREFGTAHPFGGVRYHKPASIHGQTGRFDEARKQSSSEAATEVGADRDLTTYTSAAQPCRTAQKGIHAREAARYD